MARGPSTLPRQVAVVSPTFQGSGTLNVVVAVAFHFLAEPAIRAAEAARIYRCRFFSAGLQIAVTQ